MTSTAPLHLDKFESVQGNPVIVYHSALEDESLPVLYECLRRMRRADRLDLVLSTVGGSVMTSRRIVLLLRRYTKHLTVWVPHRARSAGTLLCLGADELVLGPMAELSPIDSHVSAAGPPPPDAPGMISAEDIRAFRRMAEDWFGVEREEDRLQVLALVAQRVFPTSLSSFYRFDKMVRQVANELLAYQLPDAGEGARQQIVAQLVEGYFSHDYVISLAELLELGLRARGTSPPEEALLWDLNRACREQVVEHPTRTAGEVVGLIAGTNFRARQVFRRVGAPMRQSNGSRSEDGWQPEDGVEANWEMDI